MIKIINTSEKFLLAIFRLVSLFIACGVIFSLILYILYNIYLTSKGLQEFETPKISTQYNYSNLEGILAKKQRLEREALALKVFESKYKDALAQSDIVSTTSFREVSEIKFRYDELILSTGADDYISRIKFKDDMYSEIEKKCPNYRNQHENIIIELEKDISLIARNNKVNKDSFSKNALENLKKVQQVPPDCVAASPELKSLTNLIIKLFPGSYGFGGENTKDEITSVIQKISEKIIDETSPEYNKEFIKSTEGLVKEMQLFVDKEIKDMTNKNLLTNETTNNLSEWITSEFKNHVNLTLDLYNDEREKNKLINIAIKNSKEDIFSGLKYLGIAMLSLMALIVFVVILSIERNIRKSDK